jgi:hypothetical protein
MITLNCTNCHAVLEMDEAFAGGVCRCRHCGAIQTVPLAAKHKNPVGKKKQGRTLYSKRGSREDALPSSGLDQLAQVVASSGLSSDTLRARPRRKPTRRQVFLIGVGAGVGLILLVAVIAMSLGRSEPAAIKSAEKSAVPADSAPVAELTATPNFCGLPLSDRVVVYVVDRGSGTSEVFSYLKEATFKSVSSLGPDHKFQIIFWNNGTDDAYPDTAPTFATPQNIDAARKSLDGVYAHGQTDVASALAKAVVSNPPRIILATGKGGQLTDEFVQQVMQIRGSRPIKIDTIDLVSPQLTPALKAIADRTGGEAHLIGEADLRRYGKD